MAAKPTSAIVPYRSIAAISSSAAKPASALTQRQDALGHPLSVTGKPKREVLLPSQEVKKGVMQYALYVANPAVIRAQEELQPLALVLGLGS